MLEMAPATYTEIMNGLEIETGLLNYHLENLSARSGGPGRRACHQASERQ